MTLTDAAPQQASTEDPDPAPLSAVHLDGVGKQFDDDWVLRGIDMSIDRGTVFGMVGPSGCGKTTTVRLALGYYRPDEGSVHLLGSDPVTRSVAERKTVGYLPQHPVLFEELTLWQNLQYHASLNGVTYHRRERLHEMLELVDLDGDRKKRVSESSGGMKRRLALAATLLHDPPLLILDEPTAGIDPILRRQLWDEFRRLRDAGTTLIVTTQFVEEAAFCDEVAILADGGVRAVGTPDELVDVAYRGRRFDLRFDRIVGGRVIDALESDDLVVDAVGVTDRTVRVVVRAASGERSSAGEHAGDLQARLAGLLDDRIGDISIDAISEVPVEWNDVFAQIVTGESGSDESAAGDDEDGDRDA